MRFFKLTYFPRIENVLRIENVGTLTKRSKLWEIRESHIGGSGSCRICRDQRTAGHCAFPCAAADCALPELLAELVDRPGAYVCQVVDVVEARVSLSSRAV